MNNIYIKCLISSSTLLLFELFLIQSFESDVNRDGNLDKLDFELTMPLTRDENVYGIKLFMLFDVKLHVSKITVITSIYSIHEI